MTRSISLFLSLVFLAQLAGCQSWPGHAPQSDRVKPGMDEVEVTATLGAPARMHETATSQRWEYCLPGAIADEYVAVDFQNGVVASSQGQLELALGPCEAALASTPASD